jgi:hypothetical protein
MYYSKYSFVYFSGGKGLMSNLPVYLSNVCWSLVCNFYFKSSIEILICSACYSCWLITVPNSFFCFYAALDDGTVEFARFWWAWFRLFYCYIAVEFVLFLIAYCCEGICWCLKCLLTQVSYLVMFVFDGGYEAPFEVVTLPLEELLMLMLLISF